MRLNIESMLGFSIMAVDGELGKVKDFYFDDESWKLRYLVVHTGSWLLGRKVLISFASVKNIDCKTSKFSVDLTCEQVEKSPDIDTEKPVYRQHEIELHSYYMLPAYWADVPGTALGGVNDYIKLQDDLDYAEEEKEKERQEKEQKKNMHLRSTEQITGYLIHASDGEIGHVKDFIIKYEDWSISALVVETRNLLAGRKVLLDVEKIERIEWSDSEVYTTVSRGDIINSPEFDLKKDL